MTKEEANEEGTAGKHESRATSSGDVHMADPHEDLRRNTMTNKVVKNSTGPRQVAMTAT